MNQRMDRSRLQIGAYHLRPYARTEAHIRDVAECGIDFIVCMDNDRPALDLFAKHGLGAIVSGVVPGWWGGDGGNAGTMAEQNPLDRYKAAAAAFEDHPAIWGIDCGDEPSALDFPHYGKVLDLVERIFPHQFAYLNLYPNYASVSQNNATETVNQLGTPTYGEHIRRYCECVPSAYLCYDFYLYSINVTQHYENLRVVADACRNTGRSMWIVLQVNSNRPEEWMSLNNLRFQAYTSMAFGAEVITWACYTAGWWHNQVLDREGNKTEQYDKLKAMNAELRTLGETYMKYRRVATHFVGMAGHPHMAAVAQEAVEELSTGVFQNLKAEGGQALVVGEMVSRTPKNLTASVDNALMVACADDPHEKAPQSYRITFRADNRRVKAYGGCGELPLETLPDGSYALAVESNMGVLITAELA